MKQRIFYLDVLRVFSMFGVLLIHVVTPVFTSYGFIELDRWMVANILDSLVRWSVPMFVMISGALLLNPRYKNEKVTDFYKKRFLKIVIPLVFWMLVYFVYRHFRYDEPLSIFYFLQQVVFNQPYHHFYVAIFLCELYAITPLLRHVLEELKQSQLFVLLGLFSLVTWFWIPTRFVVPFFIPYISYFLAGYLFSTIDLSKILPYKKHVFFFFLMTVFCVAVGTYFLTTRGITRNQYFHEFTNPVVWFGTMLLFLGVRMVFQKYVVVSFLQKAVVFVSVLSFGIYLIHPMILDGMRDFFRIDVLRFENVFVGTTIVFVLLSIVTVGFVFLLKRQRIFKLFM